MMRNRAKCKECGDVIESFMQNDYACCSCGNIAVNHGPALFCSARDWSKFLRVSDTGDTIEVVYKERDAEPQQDSQVQGNQQPDNDFTHKPTREEIIGMLDDMINSYHHLPQQAMIAPITHADQLSLLMLVSSLFKSLGNSSTSP